MCVSAHGPNPDKVAAWRAVAAVADRQHGVVSRQQLQQAGLAASAVDHALASARLFAMFRSAYGLGHRPPSRKAELMAATLACGEGAVVSHGTAAHLLGLWEYGPDQIEVIAPVEAGRAIEGIRRRHVPLPAGEEVWLQDLVPCTSPARTIVDICGLRTRGPRGCGRQGGAAARRAAMRSRRKRMLRGTLEQAAVLRMLDVPAIDAVLDGPRRRGTKLLLRVLEPWRRYKPGLVIRSRLEAKMLPLMSEFAVPVPAINERLSLGTTRLEIDFLWRRAHLAVETDGGLVHGTPEAAARDAARDRALEAAGFRVWRLSWDEVVYREEATMHELNRLLRDPRRTPPSTPRTPVPPAVT